MIPPDIGQKIRKLVREHFPRDPVEPLTEAERFKLAMARKNATEPGEVIDLHPGRDDSGNMVFSHINDRWRNASYERRSAIADTKRVAVEQAAKERL